MSFNLIDQSKTSRPVARIPLSVFVLGAGIFVVGTTEFMIAGLLPMLASELGVSVPRAGLLISAFALGMVVGAPAMTVLTLRLPRKTTLMAALVVFVGAHVVSALAPTYGVLLAARVVTALATGAFWAVAAVVTISQVPASIRARALAILIGGLTVANVAGVPLGTLVGVHLGWRAAFWAVAVAAGAALVAVVLVVPGGSRSTGGVRLGSELAAFRSRRLWLALATTALFQASIFGTFSYVTPLLTEVAGLAKAVVPGVLAAFGVGSLIGSQLGGRFADRHPWPTMFGGLTAVVVNLIALAMFARFGVAAVVLVFTLGVSGFTLAAPLNARILGLAGPAPTLASASTTSAFNVGNTIGPWLGGLVIARGFGYAAPPWMGAALATGALALAAVSRGMDRRAEPEPTQQPAMAGSPVA